MAAHAGGAGDAIEERAGHPAVRERPHAVRALDPAVVELWFLQSSVPVIVQKYGNPPQPASPTTISSATPVIVPSCKLKTSLQCSNSPSTMHCCPARSLLIERHVDVARHGDRDPEPVRWDA